MSRVARLFASLFDHLVGAGEHGRRQVEPQRLRGFEFTVLRPRITDQPHSAAGCMALEGMVGLMCNQESGDVDNPASSDDCHIHWKSTNADWPASSDRRKSNDTVLMRRPL